MSEPTMKVMTFRVGSELYGLELLRVREIVGLSPITRVPNTPPFVRGVVNLRGRIIPVLDLGERFGLGRSQTTEQTVVIFVDASGGRDRAMQLGLLVDEVLEVLRLAPEDLQAPPTAGGAIVDTQFVSGVGHSGKRIFFLLDLDRVLSASEQTALSVSQPGAAP